jgi:hypothetical protein
LAVRLVVPIVVVSLELAPMVVDELVPLLEGDAPALVDDWLVVLAVLLPAVSVEGVVEALPLVEAPAPVLGVAAVEPVPLAPAVPDVVPLVPAAGVLPLVPDVEPDEVWAEARPNAAARAAAMTVMLNVR